MRRLSDRRGGDYIEVMNGAKEIIELLNEVLTAELTATNQYWIHARMCKNWGYERLWEKIRAEAIEEMKHADELVSRILFLEGVPNLQRYGKIDIGETVPEQLRLDVGLERRALESLNRGIEKSRLAGDNATRAMLEKILADEEEHTDWLETQLGLIERIGEPHYLAQQVRG